MFVVLNLIEEGEMCCVSFFFQKFFFSADDGIDGRFIAVSGALQHTYPEDKVVTDGNTEIFRL